MHYIIKQLFLLKIVSKPFLFDVPFYYYQNKIRINAGLGKRQMPFMYKFCYLNVLFMYLTICIQVVQIASCVDENPLYKKCFVAGNFREKPYK